MPKRFALAVLGLLVVTATWAQEVPKPEACPNTKGWKPTDENLQDRLQKDKSEDLCNVDLSGAQLANAHLSGAKLIFAKLNGANLSNADLNDANLSNAELNNADLSAARLNNANLEAARLNNANLFRAELNNANLQAAELNHAHLGGADLNRANLFGADLDTAELFAAALNQASLDWARLNNANLSGATLRGAHLETTSVAGARLAHTNLTNASYAPASAPPDSYVAGIQGLTTVFFPAGAETGLVQLRDLLQKAGLRGLEREATFAIEHGNTKHSLDDWRRNPAGAAEGIFRYVAFDLTTRYGLRPSRALLLIAALWLLLIPIYAWPIWQANRPLTASNICRIWPKERVEVREHRLTLGNPARIARLTLDNPARIEQLHARGLAAIGWSAYFSLLSAFQIGYREFSVGSWLSRAQPRNFALESTGWVRTVSGIQSLLSVYLLAIWLLTYFGRPFQ
jgi:uncharacterized protein YjbI with pentapeptide repeats